MEHIYNIQDLENASSQRYLENGKEIPKLGQDLN
jgi:hypothetical protein